MPAPTPSSSYAIASLKNVDAATQSPRNTDENTGHDFYASVLYFY
jgi:hypothetical protein